MPKRGEIISGEIIRIKKNNKTNKDIGALVKLASGETAFLPIKEVSTEYVNKMEDYVKVGDSVTVNYIEYNRKFNEHRVSLKRATNEYVFQKKLDDYLKTSSQNLRQLQKNKERKQTGRRKRPTTNNKKD